MNLGKYSFDSLIGNSVNISLLKRSIGRGTFKQFTIFSGILGTGKSTCAKIAAMALTCENPSGGQPCLKCGTCKGNISLMETTGESLCVKIINAGKLMERNDVKKVIHEMFDFQSSVRNRVFIIEEAHALKSLAGAQTAFLTEIDRMPANTFMIMCTTRVSDIIDELKSRAVVYSFGRLADNEAQLLLDHEAAKRSVRLSKQVCGLILQNSRGIPRGIINALDYVVENEVTEEELRAFLQVIDDASVLQVFRSMYSDEIGLYMECVSGMLSANQPEDILNAFKDYIVKVVFLVEGGINEGFSVTEAKELKQIFSPEIIQKITVLLDRSSYKLSAADLQVVLLRMRSLIQKRQMSSIVADTKRVGVVEKMHAQKLHADLEETKAGEVKLKKLTVDRLNNF